LQRQTDVSNHSKKFLASYAVALHNEFFLSAGEAGLCIGSAHLRTVNDATPSVIEFQRLQRAADLLKLLHGDRIPAHPESGDSFMERVQRIVSEATRQ
jgi:hypothetical protein